MFDPFGDFESAGYLRNVERLKDREEIKVQEHLFFEANLESALTYLERCRGEIGYEHFLEVHRMLFGEFYPWAGQDRLSLGVGRLVGKGDAVQFEVSEMCRAAVECGLRLGNNREKMKSQPGHIMGLFAWGHPFLDGNGRSMLLVHSVLSHRAGFTIRWSDTRKHDYLDALTKELQNPLGRHLDAYLHPLIQPVTAHGSLLSHLQGLPGLDGRDDGRDANVAYAGDDAEAMSGYLNMKKARGDLDGGQDDETQDSPAVGSA